MNPRYKILVSAYACEPGIGSEPEVGWQWVQQLARFHNIWVITRTNNRNVIRQSGIENLFPNLSFEYIDLPKWLCFWKKGRRGIHVYYFLWQIRATLKGLFLHRRFHFDICHHLTFSPFYQPPIFAFLPIPFMWGPIGGGERLNRAFLPLFTINQKIREYLRSVVRLLSIWNPLISFAFWKSRLIIAATQDTFETIPESFRDKVILEAQIGMNKTCIPARPIKNNKLFKVVTASRHVYWKGIILVIRSFAKFLEKFNLESELKILGTGPETLKLKNEVKRLGIESYVKFTGHLPRHDDVLETFRESNVFFYASLIECAGFVVLEALSQGTPVVCLDLPGPKEIVDETSGIKVPASDPESSVLGLSEALYKIAKDKIILIQFSQGAIKRVENNFLWNLKGDRLQSWIVSAFNDLSK